MANESGWVRSSGAHGKSESKTASSIFVLFLLLSILAISCCGCGSSPGRFYLDFVTIRNKIPYIVLRSRRVFSARISFVSFFFSRAARFREPLTFLSQHSPPILEIAPLSRLRDPGRRRKELALWADGMSLLSSLMAQDQMAVIVVDTDSYPEETSSFSEADLTFEDTRFPEIISVSSMEGTPPASLLRPNAGCFAAHSRFAPPLTTLQWASSLLVESYSSDLDISTSSVEEISTSMLSKENIAHEVKYNERHIEDICICCGGFEIYTQHPLFHGGMCAPCSERFLERFFLCDDDGYQADCTICCWGKSLIMCDHSACHKCFCEECVDTLVYPGCAEEIKETTTWICFMCAPQHVNGLLKRRIKWRAILKNFYDQESNSTNIWIYQLLSPWERKSIHVLSLFDNITEELKSLGFLEERRGNGYLKYMDDVTDVIRTNIEEWGPFDFIFGSTPPVAKFYKHPSAWYFYQYFRILQYGSPEEKNKKPFFWLFVDNIVLDEEERDAASRFFQMEAVLRYKQDDSNVQNAVHIWSNIPSVNSFGLLVLFLWVWRSAETEVIGIIGSSIELQCSYPEEESLNYNTNRILWQIKDRFSCFVAGYFPNENMEEDQCEEFKRRTLLNEPKQGSASLQLSNIRIADEFIYECIIQKKINGRFKLIHNESISLKVAANYSKPVITGPVQLGEEIMFMCNSSHGYPEQKLYWINEMDNSTMNITVQFTKELDGSFSVFSTLKMKVASDIKLGCTIEHKQLHQNITTTIDLKNSTNSPIIYNKYHERAVAFSIPIAVLILFIACISWKICKHSPRTTYTAPVEVVNFQGP
ncbi:uncharacterized protein LOC117669437 isoform X3 [Pantherophis guttatus]|uniref:Uncharacterized protein LOC117669437 isoform X3 n=1 Tax=Pantherophis guttatus TaxID=94885 RepID=A0A6P9CIT9_PANGU|nr:uncharacterized protein LOC117669437 isoform X3 [Pantherophis guttatus]